MFLSIVDFFAVRKNWRETYISIFLPVAGLIFDEKIFYGYLWRVLSKMHGGLLLLVANEIECADRIVHETGTYKAVVVSGKAGECFISF